jgi:Tol biopolymer transport system component
LPGPDDLLKGALERLAAPADPSGAYEGIVEKKVRRRFLRRAEIAGLVIVVLAGTIGGTFALARVFRSGPAAPRPVAPSARNSKIAFVSNRDGHDALYVMNADGTGLVRLSEDSVNNSSPAWSLDGRRIAFVRWTEEEHPPRVSFNLAVMNADGSGLTNLTHNKSNESVEIGHPTWSPDGTMIAFDQQLMADQTTEIYVVNADGSNLIRLTNDAISVASPAWSPDGKHIAFFTDVGLALITPDGTGRKILLRRTLESSPIPESWSPDGRAIALVRISYGPTEADVFTDISLLDLTGKERRLTRDGHSDAPVWSPDGTKIAFVRTRNGNADIYLMNPDGTEISRLTEDPAQDVAPSWQPVPVGALPSPTESPSLSPQPTPSPSPAWPLPRCATSWVNGDFDGDSLLDTAAICRLKGGTFTLNVQWASGATGAVSLPDCQSACEAHGTGDLNGDGKDEFFLVYSAGASTEFVEVFELPTSEIFGRHPAKIAPPGSPPGFPPGASAQFDLGGSVTHQGYLTCTIPKGGSREVVSTGTVLSSDQTTWKVHETRFSFSPGKDELGQFAVVSVRDYSAPVDPDRPFVPPGDPCLDI